MQCADNCIQLWDGQGVSGVPPSLIGLRVSGGTALLKKSWELAGGCCAGGESLAENCRGCSWWVGVHLCHLQLWWENWLKLV